MAHNHKDSRCNCNDPDYSDKHMRTDGGSDAVSKGQEIPKNIRDGSSQDLAEWHFSKFISALGLDVENDEHLQDTPKRVARSRFNELFRGLKEDPRKHLARTFEDYGQNGNDSGLVIVDNIQIQSMCAHHFLPFRGVAHVGYIPDGEVVGLSKLARVSHGYARRPQVQERLTNQIADAIDEELNPKAAIVVVEAEHECMTLRGVQEPNTMTRTSSLRGDAHDDESIKQEFFQLVNGL